MEINNSSFLNEKVVEQLKIAEALFKSKKYHDSNETCDKLLNSGLRNARLLHLKGLNCIFLSHLADAVEFLHQSTIYDPVNEKVWLNLGYANAKLEDFERALEAYQNGLQINPKSSSASNGCGLIYYKLGNYQEATEMFHLSTQNNPNDEKAQINLKRLSKIISQS